MNQRETLAYPGGPAKAPTPSAPATSPSPAAGTLLAEDASAATNATLFAAESSSETLAAPNASDNATLAAPGGAAGTNAGTLLPPGGTRGYATVLPDVRSEGDQLIIVPRDQPRYENNQVLGRGAMGEVKLAHDHDIGRKIAVKRLLDEQNPHAVARFIDEVRTVGSLEHPNIVPIHDVGVDEDGSLFFVMRYVEGETLQDIIDKLRAGDPKYHDRYSFEARLDLFAGLVRALQYAHDRGLVHRDIKPENIMVGRFGEVMLMDWGVAHHMRADGSRAELPGLQLPNKLDIDRASTETVDGSVIGTPKYMSPEQAAGAVTDLDGRSDLYSAFVVLYELLTLRDYVTPGPTAMATVVAAQDKQPPMPTEQGHFAHPTQAPVPIELRHFIRDGLANDRDDRFATAEEVLYTLEHVRAGDFAVACPITFMKANNTKLERFMDRYPVASMGLATMTVLGFIGGLAGWVMWAVG